MPSYDKEKLLALMELRRAAHLALTDLGDRWRGAKDDKTSIAARIRAAAVEHRAAHGFVERLLSLPLAEASSLTHADVEGYDRKVGNASHRYQTGVNFQTYQRYIMAREKEERLSAQYAADQKKFNDRFAIVSRLSEAVRAWGFTDPQLEM